MKKWGNWINYTRLSRLEGCLNFVNNVKGVDRVLIGVDNFKQFQEITNIKYKNKLKFPKYLQSKDQKLINPNLW